MASSRPTTPPIAAMTFAIWLGSLTVCPHTVEMRLIIAADGCSVTSRFNSSSDSYAHVVGLFASEYATLSTTQDVLRPDCR